MSTDDLVRRARLWATNPQSQDTYAAQLVSELADEVDRLNAACDLNTEGLQIELATAVDTLHETQADLDAARAALGRVRGVLGDVTQRDDTGWYVDREALARALAGEPS